MLKQKSASEMLAQFASDVKKGLTQPDQKALPSMYLYDDLGSALFEAITLLPEYGLTRADERLLKFNADAIVHELDLPVDVVELGSGSGRKNRWLLETIAKQQPITYSPIDISSAALAQARGELGNLPGVKFRGIEGDYLGGLKRASEERTAGRPLFVLFVGSTIGNFDRPVAIEFLREVRGLLKPGDTLLLGTDLIKATDRLIAAYDDSIGVTAAFNLNILSRINRELEADFNLAYFRHHVLFNKVERRIEMYLRSTREQVVRVPLADLEISLKAGETIWTESSHKFTKEEPVQMGEAAEFRCKTQWIDKEWPFAESLLIVD